MVLPGKTNIQVRAIPTEGSGEEYVEGFQKQQIVMDLEGGHKDTIVTMAFDPNGGGSDSSRRVVTAARDGRLLLWELTCEAQQGDGDSKPAVVVGGILVKELSMVRGTVAEQGIPVITSIVWIGDVLYVAHEDGEISVVSVSDEDVLAVEKEDEEVEATTVDDELLMGGDNVEAKDDLGEKSSKRVHSRVLEDDEDDEDDELVEQGKSGASKFIDDEADAEENDGDVTTSMNVEKDTAGLNGDEHDDDMTQPMAGDDDDNFDFEDHNDPLDMGDVPTSTNYSFPPLQPAFAPSSTPIGDSRRILCWNHMGVVTLRPDVEIDGNNLVDISFHDNAGLVGGRRPITFTDNVGFILGTLGDEGGLFASDLMEEEDDDEFDEDGLTAGLSEATRKAVKRSQKKLNGNDSAKGSSVYFHRFDTFGKTSDKDWVYALPDGERVLGCATGSGWCSVMTR